MRHRQSHAAVIALSIVASAVPGYSLGCGAIVGAPVEPTRTARELDPVIVLSSEIAAHALTRSALTLPADVLGQAPFPILVDVEIGEDGVVACVRVRARSHEVRRQAEIAARRWTFRPFVVEGVARRVVTRMAFNATKGTVQFPQVRRAAGVCARVGGRAG